MVGNLSRRVQLHFFTNVPSISITKWYIPVDTILTSALLWNFTPDQCAAGLVH
ncbi:hypothetical protein T02_3107 [Trichinella nativa]|uniref:Uncharacterized protein n=1 Tax=Trichinella nativa TaxID=6335 RepID=A0A0V1KJN8_9BILA|nr:hypothetical protein T02_3107 [Trichinella nativa]